MIGTFLLQRTLRTWGPLLRTALSLCARNWPISWLGELCFTAVGWRFWYLGGAGQGRGGESDDRDP